MAWARGNKTLRSTIVKYRVQPPQNRVSEHKAVGWMDLTEPIERNALATLASDDSDTTSSRKPPTGVNGLTKSGSSTEGRNQ